MNPPASRKYRHTTVTAVVIANMIGTGVFTGLGFQLVEIRSGFVLLSLWVLGGLISLCGAMTYAELGAALPRSGGEYNFLSRIYHPAAGFASGWTSATIGFAAPTALAAITFARYLSAAMPFAVDDRVVTLMACTLVIVLTGVHAANRRSSGGLQSFFTVLKILAIVLFCVTALLFVDAPQAVDFTPSLVDLSQFTSAAFAVALIYVSYAYTGWNAATYLSSELENPQRTLPGILFAGTAVVTLLYVGLNYVFLRVAPMDAMSNQLEVGFIAAEYAYGEWGARIAGTGLALLLISTVSAMTLAGPRVIQVIGEDFRALRVLARVNKDGLPYIAIATQSALALVFIVTSTFESILVFAGFTLALNSFVTVAGVFVLRARQPALERPYRTFAFPLTPAIYLVLMGWTLGYLLITRPIESFGGLAIIASGLLVYWLSAISSNR